MRNDATMSTLTMTEAVRQYRAGNNAGEGYAPYTDDSDGTIESAVEAAKRDGWEVELRPATTDEVVVLRNGDGERMLLGGDAMGRSVWAVMVGSVTKVTGEVAPVMSNDEIVRLKDAPDRVVSWAIANRERVLPKGVSLQDFLDHGTYHPTDDHVRLTFGGVSNKWRVE